MPWRPEAGFCCWPPATRGWGDDVYFDYVCRFDSAEAAMDDFMGHGFKMGAHKSYLFSRTLLSHEVVVDSRLGDDVLHPCHLVKGEAQETLDRWIAGFTGPSAPGGGSERQYKPFSRPPSVPLGAVRAFINHFRRFAMIQFLVHEKADSVGVATVDIKAGEKAKGLFMDSQDPVEVEALNDIPLGHKIAMQDQAEGDTVIKYGHDIGKVVASFKKGEHVHIHNLKTKRVVIMSLGKVLGYRRENGRVGIRNHVVILPLDDLSNAACEAGGQ